MQVNFEIGSVNSYYNNNRSFRGKFNFLKKNSLKGADVFQSAQNKEGEMFFTSKEELKAFFKEQVKKRLKELKESSNIKAAEKSELSAQLNPSVSKEVKETFPVEVPKPVEEVEDKTAAKAEFIERPVEQKESSNIKTAEKTEFSQPLKKYKNNLIAPIIFKTQEEFEKFVNNLPSHSANKKIAATEVNFEKRFCKQRDKDGNLLRVVELLEKSNNSQQEKSLFLITEYIPGAETHVDEVKEQYYIDGVLAGVRENEKIVNDSNFVSAGANWRDTKFYSGTEIPQDVSYYNKPAGELKLRLNYKPDGKTLDSKAEHSKDFYRLSEYDRDGALKKVQERHYNPEGWHGIFEEYYPNGALLSKMEAQFRLSFHSPSDNEARKIYYKPDGSLDKVKAVNIYSSEYAKEEARIAAYNVDPANTAKAASYKKQCLLTPVKKTWDIPFEDIPDKIQKDDSGKIIKQIECDMTTYLRDENGNFARDKQGYFIRTGTLSVSEYNPYSGRLIRMTHYGNPQFDKQKCKANNWSLNEVVEFDNQGGAVKKTLYNPSGTVRRVVE